MQGIMLSVAVKPIIMSVAIKPIKPIIMSVIRPIVVAPVDGIQD